MKFKFTYLFATVLSLTSVSSMLAVDNVRTDVLNRSYYNDIFLDCGIGLTTLDSLPAASMLNLKLEKVGYSSDAERQNQIIAGDSTDWNGHLLYPDGAPRFKVFFMNGGSSLEHASSLGEASRRRIKEFVNAGGSYVGTCAGAIITSQGYDETKCPTYLSLWPGMFGRTGKAKVYTGVTIEKYSPLLKYYDFGGDKYIKELRHNHGNYPLDLPKGAEVLARYDFKEGGKMHGQPVVSAYKKDANTGRLVLCGSHPEEIVDGERRDLCAAMIKYAIDGRGITKIKGYLKNGEVRKMDRHTYERNPDFTRIGDMQSHHFAVEIPKGARDVTFKLVGAEGSHMTLAVCKDTYAYDDVADFRSIMDGNVQQFSMARPAPGLWYVCVKCLDQPVSTNAGQAHIYTKLPVNDLLNGVPYTIEVSWK